MAEENYSNIEISPGEVKDRLAREEHFLFVDVREPWEYETAHIQGARLIPMREIPEHVGEFEDSNDIVLFCHHGMRSLDAASWLRSQGIEGARSMAGGIDRWSVEVDSQVPRY